MSSDLRYDLSGPARLVTQLELKCNSFCISIRVATSNYSKSFSIIRNDWRLLEMNSSHLKTVFTLLALQPLHKFQTGMRFSYEQNLPETKWISNSSKYWVVLKRSRNKTSCEQNLFTGRFEISNRHEFISLLMQTYSKCHLPFCSYFTKAICRFVKT